MKNQIIRLRLLVVMLGVILFSFTSKAQTETLRVGTQTRTMLVYAPPAIEKNRPLLISMHGLNQDITYQKGQTQWETVAKANGFVVVYPAGINNSWDISGTTDTDFILAIINEMVKRYGIDRKRVYLSGFSMGGMMTYHAATKIADKIAAFAPVSGYLMGGPNTNSSRSIPIIHTHGTGDPVVPYSGVSTCLNAWIERNGCSKIAKVTKPYPANKPSSNGTKSVWGPGTDQVQVVLLSLEGVGHWHSNDGNGVNTSQEIWNFCKNFSLGFGVSEFSSAAVTEDNPKLVRVAFTKPLKQQDSYTGFVVKLDNVAVPIDSVVYGDTTHLNVYITDSISKLNSVLLTYYNGNVVSTYDKKMENFKNTPVVNLLPGSSPIITEITTTKNGDSLLVKFNKKMLLPTVIDSLSLTSVYKLKEKNIPLLQPLFSKNDSTVLAFSVSDTLYADYALSCSYTGNTIASADSGLLLPVTDFAVNNLSSGLPVQVKSGRIETDGFTVDLIFSKPMDMKETQLKQLVVKVNDVIVKGKEVFVSNTSVRFKLAKNVHFGDKVTLNYIPGTVAAADKGPLDSITNLTLSNKVTAPAFVGVPAKIEAEKYIAQYGVQTETTSDTGGGSNVGYIDNTDWMEYAIENNSAATSFNVTFRAASPYGGAIACYIDEKSVGTVNVPNTGNWQTYQSVTKTISIPAGKHYLKLVASTGGFNLNYMDVRIDLTDVDAVSEEKVTLFPNPVTNALNIHATDFRHNKVEVFNIVGAKVISCATNGESDLRIPVQLPNGIYLVKISDEKQYQLIKMMVKNN
ncbi:MAG: carbohydrate-binding protein [Bacteroidales bacterium]|nr:carbohydrate-binding protein [Bacteroidales bacterium]